MQKPTTLSEILRPENEVRNDRADLGAELLNLITGGRPVRVYRTADALLIRPGAGNSLLFRQEGKKPGKPDKSAPGVAPASEKGLKPTKTVTVVTEEDTNKDGVYDRKTTTVTRDTDGDGKPEYRSETVEEDRDGDGKYERKTRKTTSPIGNTVSRYADRDGDGVPDEVITDLDLDRDGRVDWRTKTTFKDTDGDGKFDRQVTVGDLDMDGKFDDAGPLDEPYDPRN